MNHPERITIEQYDSRRSWLNDAPVGCLPVLVLIAALLAAVI